MSKSMSLITEARHREPGDWTKQAAFMGSAIGKLMEQQLNRSPELDDQIHGMIIAVLEALELPEGPLLIPGEGLPLIMSVEEGKAHDEGVLEHMREMEKSSQAG